jgi:hypothetical protein
MSEKQTAFANPKAQTILPRHGSGQVKRIDEKPTLTAYDLSSIPSRVHPKPSDAITQKPVYAKQGSIRMRRKQTPDPFIDRLSRLG